MHNLRFSPGLLAVGFILAASAATPSRAQERRRPDFTTSLLDQATCVSSQTSGSSKPLKEEVKPLSFNYRIYESKFHLLATEGYSSRLTCKVNSERYSVLRLQMGIPDEYISRNQSMTINVIQDGNVIETYRDITASKLISVPINLKRTDMKSPRDVAIDIQCHQVTGRHCYFHFVEATLLAGDSYGNETFQADAVENSSVTYWQGETKILDPNNTVNPEIEKPKKKKSFFEGLDDFNRSLDRFNNTIRRFTSF